MLTYKFRLYPTKPQQELLWAHANLLNKLYNYFLSQKIDAYIADKTKISKSQQQAEIVNLLNAEDWAELKTVHSQVRQQVTDRLDKTYRSFFNRGFGFPRFRSCKNFFGICYPQSGYALDLQTNTITTKAYGPIKFKQHQTVTGEVKRIHIKCDAHNKWYVCITTTAIKNNKGNGTIAIDLGLTNLTTSHTGQKIRNQRHDKYFDKQIDKLKSRQSTTTKGSRKYKHFKSTITNLYGAKTRKTTDFLHKASYGLSITYDTIICEDLDIKSMTETNKHGLNRADRNASWGKFTNYLGYKVNRLLKVNPAYTSQVCNNCGKLHKLSLKHRIMSCECGNIDDRDVNAAKNIFCLGQAILVDYRSECAVGTSSFLQETLSFR